jgi:hypothetical protein
MEVILILLAVFAGFFVLCMVWGALSVLIPWGKAVGELHEQRRKG